MILFDRDHPAAMSILSDSTEVLPKAGKGAWAVSCSLGFSIMTSVPVLSLGSIDPESKVRVGLARMDNRSGRDGSAHRWDDEHDRNHAKTVRALT